MSEKLIRNIRAKLNGNDKIVLLTSEEYFYVLAQLIVYSFEKMGGADKFRKEFSYLTCPNIPCGAVRLNQRGIHFLRNANDRLFTLEGDAKVCFNSIMEWDGASKLSSSDRKYCEEAFYDGVYEKNLFL
jgi:hypothetical protein